MLSAYTTARTITLGAYSFPDPFPVLNRSPRAVMQEHIDTLVATAHKLAHTAEELQRQLDARELTPAHEAPSISTHEHRPE